MTIETEFGSFPAELAEGARNAVEVCLAIVQSAAERREIPMAHQVPADQPAPAGG